MILRITREKVGHRQGPTRQTPNSIELGVCICGPAHRGVPISITNKLERAMMVPGGTARLLFIALAMLTVLLGCAGSVEYVKVDDPFKAMAPTAERPFAPPKPCILFTEN